MIQSRPKLKSILEYFTQKENKMTKPKEEGEKYYVINSSWISNMVVFIKLMIESPDDESINTLFNLNNVCLLFFESDQEEDKSDLIGCYPGVINNFLLTTSKRILKDPQINSSELVLKKEARENSDYILVSEKIYMEIETSFSFCEKSIERNSIKFNEDLLVDVHLSCVFINIFILGQSSFH